MARRKTPKEKQPKKPNYVVIDEATQEGVAVIKVVAKMVKAHHKHLMNAKIVPAWMLGKKPDKDGHVVLGRMRKCSELERELHGRDAILLLNQAYWRTFSEAQREALVDHELCHLDQVLDADLEPAVDGHGKPKFRIRKHDLEEFRAVVERHGCYLADLKEFAQAALKKDPNLSLFPEAGGEVTTEGTTTRFTRKPAPVQPAAH